MSMHRSRTLGSPSCLTRVRQFAGRVWLLLALLAFEAAAEPASFRFAWLTDTHVGSSTGEEDLRAAVRDLNSLTGLSFVLLSGDITEYGSREQLQLAKEILAGLTIPYHLIPGNHDTKWSESGATDFPRLWDADRFRFERGGYCFIGMHQGPVMRMGDGHWAPEDVRWLETTLRGRPDTNQPLVFVTHYPIDDGIANWYVVLDLLKRYNTQVVLCGHGHANQPQRFEGVPGVMGRSNLRARRAAGGFNLVEVAAGKMTFSERVTGRETLAPWHSVDLQRHDYAADTNAYPRPDFSVNARYPTVVERWAFASGFTIAGSPAVWRDLAIVGDASGSVTALSVKSGKPKWQFKTRGAVLTTPEVNHRTVAIASTDGEVYALRADTGKELWRYATGRPIVASPRVANELVYLGSSEGKFRALNLASGKLAWQFSGLGGFVETKPLVFADKVVFGAWDQHLYALNAKNGHPEWTWRGDKPGALLSPAACWPVGAAGKIFIVAPDRKMTALDARTGAEVWRSGEFEVRESIGLARDESRVYVRAMHDRIGAFATKPARPEKVWDLNAHFGYDINSAMLVEQDGVLFYGTKNGLLLALDARTGALRWEHKVGVALLNTVVPLNARQVLLADFDGKVTLVEETGQR